MKDRERAIKSLTYFYQICYSKLGSQLPGNNIRVDGFLLSDSGVLFVRNGNNQINKTNQLIQLLRIIERINRKMLKINCMLTTSIAYGYFKYHSLLEFQGIEKNPLYGDGYVEAFMDSEIDENKIQPGQCRIIKKNLPKLDKHNKNEDPIYSRLIDVNGLYYYYYWMVRNNGDVKLFEKNYNDAYSLKYEGMLKALKMGNNPYSIVDYDNINIRNDDNL